MRELVAAFPELGDDQRVAAGAAAELEPVAVAQAVVACAPAEDELLDGLAAAQREFRERGIDAARQRRGLSWLEAVWRFRHEQPLAGGDG